MALQRLFAHHPNALRVEDLPALTREEFRQRDNESQFTKPDSEYPSNWEAAKEDARIAWLALGLDPKDIL